MNLKEKLIKEQKNRWLDVGNGGNFEEGFYYLDTLPVTKVKSKYRKNYFEMNICRLSNDDIKKLGKFDYIRMQHLFEHLSYEEGKEALKNCAELLNKNGIITISTPDLRVYINKYLNNDYKKWDGFKCWAHKRIPLSSPNSFYFSIFAHSMPWEQHKWCYDGEGLIYQVKKSGKYKNIRELKINDELANNPFTHNRPEEDVCVIAARK